jgi:hypothetical protein
LDQKLGLTAEGYSPRVVQMVVRQGSKSPSFGEASDDLRELAQIEISPRHTETLVERVGSEWARNRDAEVAAFRQGQLKRDFAQPPTASAVMLDGGRAQTRAEDQPPGVHEPGWKETKVACCLTLNSKVSEQDPQPEPPAKFLDPPKVTKLVRQIKARSSVGGSDGHGREGKDKGKQCKTVNKKRKRRRCKKKRNKRLVRTAVATMANAETFGWQMAAEVHRRGLDQATRKACVCDGALTNWSIFEMHLEPSGFIGILDFLHLLVYLFAAAGAVAGKRAEQRLKSWTLYERWMRWAWAGKAREVLEELKQAAEKLGRPPPGADEKDPRQVLAEAVSYVNNNQARMDYPRYRKLGLPISSAPVESLIKQFNRRVKGSEKFWLKPSADAVLQVRAAYLSEDGRAERYWDRPRPYRRAAGIGPPARKAA